MKLLRHIYKLIIFIPNFFYKIKYNFFYKYYNFVIVKSHKSELFIGGKTFLSSNTILNLNPNFNGMIIKGGGEVLIGDNFHSGENCLILTSFHDYDNGSHLPYGSTFVNKDINIKDNVWVGSRVIILGGVTIGEGAIIQAGSVVVSDVEDFAIVGGSPAKKFKSRDVNHYDRLFKENKFH
ncbi:acyltransferase [Flavobacterium sp.]|jgi:chloramphenicol O-acetyltransferase type B|uniref:acyltransferase n=1 Tax=Flavobacterium sp. TaxID=239 RepID=UPI0037BECF13